MFTLMERDEFQVLLLLFLNFRNMLPSEEITISNKLNIWPQPVMILFVLDSHKVLRFTSRKLACGGSVSKLYEAILNIFVNPCVIVIPSFLPNRLTMVVLERREHRRTLGKR